MRHRFLLLLISMIMKFFTKLPHKNVIASIIFALGILIIGIWINRSPGLSKTESGDVIIKTTTEEYRDSDGDGLPDWQEALYGSNMELPDTDGDGTPDGAEVASGRDPTVPGPDDRFSITPPRFATSTVDEAGLRKEFYAQFLSERGDIIREATVKELVKNFNAKEFVHRYNLVDLKITSATDPDGLRAYGNAFGAVVAKYRERVHRTETEILGEAIKTKNEKVLQELQLPAITYRNFANDLRALPVPSSLAADHLGIVNGYDTMGRATLAFTALFRDPVRAQGAYQAYLKETYALFAGYNSIARALHQGGVVYGKDDPGYLFGRNSTSTTGTVKKPSM